MDAVTYEARHDPQALRRFSRAARRRYWPAWIKSAFIYGIAFWCCTGFSNLIANSSVEAGVSMGSLQAPFIGFGLGVLLFVVYILGLDAAGAKYDHGQVWQCVISDDAWSFRDSRGMMIEIPWRIMSLTFEHPDGLDIQYGRNSVMVYRKPLQDAGLEELFLSRVPHR